MTAQNLDFDDAAPVTETAIPQDIISQQRASGMSSSLISMQVSPIAIAAGQIKPQKFVDGMVIAENTTNLVAFDGGAGKSTSIRHGGIKAAATGLFNMLGERQHDKPLRVALLFGEETGEQIGQSIMSIPGAHEHYMTAIRTGRLLIVSMLDYAEKAERPESIFDREGRLTPTGSAILQDLADFKPDLLVLDTLGSMSDSEYLDSLSPRNTLNILNGFCARNRCTAIAYLHLTKDAGGKFNAESSPGELLALSRGSAQLKNVTRSLIVATRAPAGMYPGIQVAAGDEIWIGTTKCNLQNAKYNNQFFPIIRDSSRMIMTAYGAGKALADEAETSSKAALRVLHEYLPHLIRAASDIFKPFSASTSSRSKLSLQNLLTTGSMSEYFDERLSPGLISSALEILIREGKIVEASNTRTNSGLVYCYPGGPFAEQAAYQERTGSKLTIREGEYPVDDLEKAMHKLHDAARSGAEVPSPAWKADAEAAVAERKQAEAAKKTAENEKAAKAKIKADRAAADEAAKSAAKALSEAKRLATLKRDVAKKDLATATSELENLAQPLKIARANFNAAQTRAQADTDPEAAEKVERCRAELADVEGRANAAKAAMNAAQESLEGAEAELIRIGKKALADAEARASTAALADGDTPF